MQKSFTLKDVAQYTSEVYRESHRNIREAAKKEGPSALAIRNILQYSKALSVCKDKSGGSLFLLMN